MDDNVTTITVEQANKLRQNCNDAIKRLDALKRLENNADFKEVFLKHYVEEEPARLVGLVADPTVTMATDADKQKERINNSMIGISCFIQYMYAVKAFGEQSKRTLNALNQANIVED